MTGELKAIGTHQGKVIIEYDGMLKPEQRERVQARLDAQFPEGVVILEGGMKVSRHEQLDRLEAKLDLLIEGLAAEAEEQDETVRVQTMDGSTYDVPRGGEFLNSRGVGQKSVPAGS